ncbi:putative membrane protein [Propionispora sp. 2/2-37]|uniref:sporulation membrane protein YtaF n=1 Tax=Propionispora sp. 2/2-37 TaxID=1677858 RepID=UPI0006BB984D|nr:sporulation membrane protein YtaF [Propionispora sp. 2/2-37]CUH97597.1 putative membrane protein [Propionispora sp. 2/2-37]
MNLLYVMLLAIALSLDGFVAGIAYGLKKITIPYISLAIVGTITMLTTAAAVFCSSSVAEFINPHAAVISGALLLIAIGIFSLFQEYLTKSVPSYQADNSTTAAKLTFSIGRIVISIMAKPETADMDHSNRISSTEAVFLGLALGIDNLVATFAAGLMNTLPLYTPILMGVIQILALYSGLSSAHKLIPAGLKRRVPYLPGVILIILGLLRFR